MLVDLSETVLRETVLRETFIRCVHTGTLMCISFSLYVIVCAHIASGSDEVSQVLVVCDTLLVYMYMMDSSVFVCFTYFNDGCESLSKIYTLPEQFLPVVITLLSTIITIAVILFKTLTHSVPTIY